MDDLQLYSLWLMPEGDEYHRLAEIIARLSHQHTTPRFEPHVTLLGSLLGVQEEILEKTGTLAGQLAPYDIDLTHIEHLNEEFRCVFLRAVESHEVMSSNHIARRVFHREDDPPYVPHLSLMYGIVPVEIKQQIIHELGRDWSLRLHIDRVHVFPTTLPTDRWSRLASFPFNG